jgi:type I restriction enzyme S subunit
MYRFRPAPKVMDAAFLEAFLQTFHAWRAIDAMKTGGSDSGLNLTHDRFRQLLVPAAPLSEQRRIVARIDGLFAEIAEGEAALAAARKGLDTFRRTLLKAAVTGELTEDWRTANPVSETGYDILTRLRKRYPNTSPTRAGWEPKGDLPPLPEGWTWCAIEEAGEVQLGRQRAPQHHDGDNMRPYLRVANVLEDRLDLSDVKWMNFTPAEFETFALLPGDILLNEGQAPDLLGRPAMYRGEIVECCFQKTLLRFRAKDGVLPDYALIVFRYYMRSGRFNRESRITTKI